VPERMQQRPPPRAKRIKIGTIVEIPVKGGVAYLQYYYKTAHHSFVRVLKGIFQRRLKDFTVLANQQEQFITSSLIEYDIGDGLCEIVGWAPIPERLSELPLFKVLSGPGLDTFSGPYYWKLWNVKNGKSWKVGGETYERKKAGEILPVEYHSLPSPDFGSLECIVDRIELGWTHESDVFGPSYSEIYRQRIQERIAAEKASAPPSSPEPISTIERLDSPRPNPIEKPLKTLLTRLDNIMAKHKELGDTDVREQLHEVIQNAFVQLQTDYVLPKGFGMFTKTGNKRVHSALVAFLRKATELILKSGLDSNQLRLAAFQDAEVTSENGSTYDEYFGDG